MAENQSRRSFLQNLGVGLGTTAAAFAVPSLVSIPESKPKYEGKKLGIALVGLGSYAKNQLAVGLEQTPNCYLAGIVTGTPAKAEEWMKKYNIPKKNVYNYQTFDQIADNKDIDVVYVVLPNSMHHEYVIRAAKAGKHVMCEKPMANSVKECEEMIKACKDAGVQLGIGYRMHFEPFTKEIIRMSREKVFGNVKFINTNFGFTIGDPTQWRLKKAMAGGGPLMDVGIYCVQGSRYITGKEPLSVTAQFGPITDPVRFKDVEESLSWQFDFPDAVTVNGFTSYKTNIEQLYATYEKGFIQLSPAYSYGPIKGRTSQGELHMPVVHHQANMLEAIAREFQETKMFPSHISGEEGLKDMRYLTAIYEAAQTGKRIILT
ncbi:Gfo/Idh/MocA family protein [Emticicia sp. BO119]|uniref:Gfo/Idh/MocA family protein n=1 Tax=Emticicia sp. BO119 TaxID=2757768 RepID=UPI0015F08CCC|nr:Gfo/Idh/MocA family oxidoreductase [Emticicia sp. BO119]MBA4851737.1 Gfo/Idh/MocA family oxidoreductase [Emticicia sp. BO119]